MMEKRDEMSYSFEPGFTRDLTQARAALAVHGIVIVRGIETELEPAIMSEVKDSLSSSPRKLAALDEDELDKILTGIRRTAIKSARELKELYVRLLKRLGSESFVDLVDELEGIGQLFRWERVAKSVEPVNEALEKRGFKQIALSGPDELSEAFQVELEDRWRPAFERFSQLAEQAAEQMRWQDERERSIRKKTGRKG